MGSRLVAWGLAHLGCAWWCGVKRHRFISLGCLEWQIGVRLGSVCLYDVECFQGRLGGNRRALIASFTWWDGEFRLRTTTRAPPHLALAFMILLVSEGY